MLELFSLKKYTPTQEADFRTSSHYYIVNIFPRNMHQGILHMTHLFSNDQIHLANRKKN